MTGDFAAKQQSSCHGQGIDFMNGSSLAEYRCSAAGQPPPKSLAGEAQ
jgi:hypothetical protein